MPLDPIKNYNMDAAGVVVDLDPITTPPNALSKSQNATNDIYGERGSLRKRPGLARFNSSAATGSVVGGIGVPIVLGSAGPDIANPFSGEAVTVANLTASTVTTGIVGNAELGDGTTFDDNSFELPWDFAFDFGEIPYPEYLDLRGYDNLNTLDTSGDNSTIQSASASTTAALTYLGGGAPLTSKLLWVLPLTSNISQVTDSVSASYPNAAFLVFPTKNTRGMVADGQSAFNAWYVDTINVNPFGSPTAVLGNVLYYTTDSAPLTVRAFDAFHDVLACTLPTGVSVMSLYGANGVLFITSIDVAANGAGGGAGTGSVYQFTPSTGLLQRLGAQFPAGHVPYSMTWAYNRLWVGTALQEPATDTTACRIYSIRPGVDIVFTLDNTFANYEDTVSNLAVFQGQIYAALVNHQQAASVTCRVAVRSTAGVWTTSDSIADTSNTAVQKGYADLVVWPPENGPVTSPTPALFSVRYIPSDTSTVSIRKLSGGSWVTVGTSTGLHANPGFGTSYISNPSNSNNIVPVIWVNTAGTHKVLNSIDGVTFTDVSASLPANYTTISDQRGIGGLIIQVPH